MDKETVIIVVAIVILIFGVLGIFPLSYHFKNQCVALIASKPAIEIQLVCK